jgi:ABC-type multidrug transport system permease subunit
MSGPNARRLLMLTRRALNEVIRVPGASMPAVVAPTLILMGTAGIFGKLVENGGFGTDQYLSFLMPWGFLQAAAFTGGATGVNFARDIEQSFVDRLLVAPSPRGLLLAANALAGAIRTLLPIALMVPVAVALGASVSSAGGLVAAVAAAAVFGMLASAWATFVALWTGTQAAAPLMQAPILLLIMLTTSYAPADKLASWMHDIADLNPVTPILDFIRRGVVSDVRWSDTWPALLALAGLGVLLFGVASWRLRRAAD